MGFVNTLYNNIFKRTSTFVLAITAGTFFFERTFDIVAETTFDKMNEGKLWKHIKHNYESE